MLKVEIKENGDMTVEATGTLKDLLFEFCMLGKSLIKESSEDYKSQFSSYMTVSQMFRDYAKAALPDELKDKTEVINDLEKILSVLL